MAVRVQVPRALSTSPELLACDTNSHRALICARSHGTAMVTDLMENVDTWVKKGGVLVRFAGPRLEKGGDDLIPVGLRLGGRTLATAGRGGPRASKFTDRLPGLWRHGRVPGVPAR